MNKKVALGMSGGIDSSLAAYLLKEEGYEVTGFTFKLWDEGSRCCDIRDIQNAQMFCHYLNIKHYVIDLRQEFKTRIVDPFISEYLNGHTPNPCVLCNQHIKFQYLFEKAGLMGFDYLATGHYARISKTGHSCFLSPGKDKKKSQEYFLARISREILPRILFPLGEITKEEIRTIARGLNFRFRTEESQEICFIKQGTTYSDFILSRIKDHDKYAGLIIDKKNIVLNTHPCFFKYTIGQRQGLGISDKTPYYVIDINAREKKVIVGKKAETYQTRCTVKDIYWYEDNENSNGFLIKIRYNHKGGKAEINTFKGKSIIEFEEPQHAITPGQLAVFYQNDCIKGSGWIDEIIY